MCSTSPAHKILHPQTAGESKPQSQMRCSRLAECLRGKNRRLRKSSNTCARLPAQLPAKRLFVRSTPFKLGELQPLGTVPENLLLSRSTYSSVGGRCHSDGSCPVNLLNCNDNEVKFVGNIHSAESGPVRALLSSLILKDVDSPDRALQPCIGIVPTRLRLLRSLQCIKWSHQSLLSMSLMSNGVHGPN